MPNLSVSIRVHPWLKKSVADEKTPPHQFSRIAEELVGDLRGVEYDEPRRSKKRPTRDLGAVVEELLQKHQIGRAAPEHTIREHWLEVVGAANASYSHAVRLERDGRMLIIACTHSVVRNELFLHRAEILARVQKLSGCGDVKDLRVRGG